MLIELPGGFDYTGADCSAWLKEAGFRETRLIHREMRLGDDRPVDRPRAHCRIGR